MNNILILFAHPALQKSRVNKRLIEYVKDLEGVKIHDLYEVYPDFNINVKREQDLLEKADIIVFHHPLYWFNVPALLKEWQDLVLEYKWAYGKGGVALKGKKLLSVITTGGRESLFQRDGFHGHTINEFLLPSKQIAFICGMDYLPPFVVHGTHGITDSEILEHADDYRSILISLRDDKILLDEAMKYSRINENIEGIILR